MSITANGLDCAVGGHVVLGNLDLDIPGGGMTAIVGANGAGKSTLLRTIAGIAPPAAGSVAVDGDDLRSIGARDRARRIAFVSQEENPPGELTVGHLVSLGRLPYRRAWQPAGAGDREAIASALDRVEMADLRDRPCGDLSGGQRRRAALARGFAQSSPWLLLDEPTNHLDVRHQHAVLRLARESGRSVVAAIHDLDLVVGYFDRVLVLHDGGLAAVGDPGDVLDGELVRRVFGVDSGHVRLPGGRRSHLVVDGEGAMPSRPGTPDHGNIPPTERKPE